MDMEMEMDTNITTEKHLDKITLEDGSIIEVEFMDGQLNGRGKHTKRNGQVYIGEFLDGSKHGKGKFTWKSGDMFIGNFVDDYCYGKGRLTKWDGRSYEGKWKYDKNKKEVMVNIKDGLTYVFMADEVDGSWVLRFKTQQSLGIKEPETDPVIKDLRSYYRSLDPNQKREFIENLQAKLENSKTSKYKRFLNECIRDFNVMAQQYNEHVRRREQLKREKAEKAKSDLMKEKGEAVIDDTGEEKPEKASRKLLKKK